MSKRIFNIRCSNKECPKRNSCKRFINKNATVFSPYLISDNPVKWGCDFYKKKGENYGRK